MKKLSINGKASICNWNLHIEFLTKHQCLEFIKLYFEESIPIHFEYTEEDDKFIIEIFDGVWANNLTTVAQLLEKVDYEV